MRLTSKISKGHKYHTIVHSVRIKGIGPREKTVLYLGRLDKLLPSEANQIIVEVKKLGNQAITYEVQAVLTRFGHVFTQSFLSIDIKTVRSYGPELALFRMAEEISLTSLIDDTIPKGGGPSLGKIALAMAIYACVKPGSVWRFVRWYKRSPLPIFLELPPDKVTYDVALNSLDYLQPEKTRILEAETYARVRKRFDYDCRRVFIDSTPVELEGSLCRIIARFGKGKGKGTSKRRQVLITFLIDQKSALVGHEVFSGNRNDAKTLSSIDNRLGEEYDEDVKKASRVVDRGYASLANVKKMKGKEENFLVALRAQPKRLKLFEKIGKDKDMWKYIFPETTKAASVIIDGIKYVVIWDVNVSKKNRSGRETKIIKAKKELESLAKSVAKGTVKSRSERDQKAGAIIRKHHLTRLLKIKGKRKGFGFSVIETDANEKQATKDGYQVFATTEISLTDKEVVEAYRSRDLIEKVIRTLKSVLGLGPFYLSTKEHVLGNIYVHALAYQLRSMMKLQLEEAEMDMTPEEALWELEQLQVAELVVQGSEIRIVRKLTQVEGVAKTLVQVFSLQGQHGFPGIEGSI